MVVRPSSLRGIGHYLRAHALACLDEAQQDADVAAALLDFTGRCDGLRCSRRFHYQREKGDTWISFATALRERKGDVIEADCEDLTSYYAAALMLLSSSPELAPEHPLRRFLAGNERPWLRITPSGQSDAHAYLRMQSVILDPSVWHGMGSPGEGFYRGPETLEIPL